MEGSLLFGFPQTFESGPGLQAVPRRGASSVHLVLLIPLGRQVPLEGLVRSLSKQAAARPVDRCRHGADTVCASLPLNVALPYRGYAQAEDGGNDLRGAEPDNAEGQDDDDP